MAMVALVRPGERVRQMREAAGLGLRETARQAGVDPAALGRFERTDLGLALENLVRVLEIIGPAEHVRILRLYSRDGGDD